jgi:serine/threonine-protein kinase
MNPSQIDRLNTALAGRYRIERELGEGGMATVYLCDDVKHDRKVALKLLKPELAAVLGAERFLQEIKTTAALQHPHILPLFDSGAADGFLFYVMPYIKGETLRDKLNRETQLGVEEAVRIAREVADALDYAHRNGVVHRDIKPENILMNDGRPMVADFGIALAVSAAAGGRMTETGLSLGTPHYMSPEQATAEKEITARSDVYSVGSVLYEMLTGHPPFTGAVAQQIIMKIITVPAESVTVHRKSVPPHVADALAKSLEKLPADRFESAKAFAEALGNPLYRSGAVQASGMHTGGGAGSVGSSWKFNRLAFTISALAAVFIGTTLWGWLKPGIVSRNSINLWQNQQIPLDRVARGLAISPDGGTVVFVDGVGSNSTQLYVKERDRLEVTALAGTAGVAGAPTFSPDGAWIAFVTGDGKVQKVPRLGGSAIAIADSADVVSPALAWLEDGTILFEDGHFDVKAVGQDGGIARHVLTNTPGDSANRNMRYLASVPGVKAALVVACNVPDNCATPELRVLDLRSDQPKVTMLATQAMNAWSLPGGIVAFARKDGGVFAAPFDNSTLTFTQPPTPMMSGVRTSVNAADMVVSANGTAIYVAGSSGGSNLMVEPVWVTRAGAATPMDSAWTMNIAQTVNGDAIALSPDGQRLALTVPRTGLYGNDIWIKQLDRTSGTVTKLTFEGNNINPRWTPDGQRVLYAGGGRSLRSRRADGTGAVDTLFMSLRGVYSVVLTPDSNTFVLRLNGPNDIALAHRGDTATVPLVASPVFSENSPALSPDGRWLAYSSNESGRFEVYVRPYPNVDAGPWQVSQAGGVSPHWSHTGRELFYENGAKALVAAAVVPGVTFTVGAQVTLFNTSGFAGSPNFLYYDVAPDDQRFVFFRKAVENGAVKVDPLVHIVNWGVEVRAKLKGKTPQ